MISIIIPTMWKGVRYAKMIPELQDHPLIGEIILIDNDISSTDKEMLKFSKVVYLPQKENIYVNPAWNLGARTAKFEKLCFLNDDIEFDTNTIIDLVYPHINPSIGIIGFSEEVIIDESTNQFIEESLYEENCIMHCAIMHPRYGICMFINKESYIEIPSDYKIWFGDNHLFNNNKIKGRSNYIIRGKNIKVKTKMSSTVQHPSTIKEFGRIVDLDALAYRNNNPQEVALESFLQSIENQLDNGLIDLNSE